MHNIIYTDRTHMVLREDGELKQMVIERGVDNG